jgi:hypothetical protein
MISILELRFGNYVLYKDGPKIRMVSLDQAYFFNLAKQPSLFYPIVLKAEILQQCGFEENKDYPLYPEAREFRLVLPVNATGQHQILAYVKNNDECFARFHVNSSTASNPVYHLHRLQNLYFALTGKEMEIRFKS